MQQEKLSDVDCALSSSQDEKCSQNTSRGGLSVKTGTEHAAGTTGEGLPGPGHPAAVRLCFRSTIRDLQSPEHSRKTPSVADQRQSPQGGGGEEQPLL